MENRLGLLLIFDPLSVNEIIMVIQLQILQSIQNLISLINLLILFPKQNNHRLELVQGPIINIISILPLPAQESRKLTRIVALSQNCLLQKLLLGNPVLLKRLFDSAFHYKRVLLFNLLFIYNLQRHNVSLLKNSHVQLEDLFLQNQKGFLLGLQLFQFLLLNEETSRKDQIIVF